MHYGARVLQLLNEDTFNEIILKTFLRKYLKSLPVVRLSGTIFKKNVGKLLMLKQIAGFHDSFE